MGKSPTMAHTLMAGRVCMQRGRSPISNAPGTGGGAFFIYDSRETGRRACVSRQEQSRSKKTSRMNHTHILYTYLGTDTLYLVRNAAPQLVTGGEIGLGRKTVEEEKKFWILGASANEIEGCREHYSPPTSSCPRQQRVSAHLPPSTTNWSLRLASLHIPHGGQR